MSFEKYYTDQANSKLPVFRGSAYQRGYGFGDVFKKIFRWIVPIVKEHAKPIAKKVGKETLKTVAHIASDTLDGKNFTTSVKNRVKDTLSKIPDGQFGNGRKIYYKKKRKLSNFTEHKKKKKKIRHF